MDLKIGGLRVLVTAGANGIGHEIAKRFLDEGARVHVCDVDDAALGKLGLKVTSSKADVANRSEVEKLFADVQKSLGGLDVLVNNAGIAGPTGRIDEIDPEDWDRCIAIDLTGLFNCSRLAVPLLKSSGNPSIINLSSVAGRLSFPLRSPYAAAKWGVVGLTKALAAELGEFGIRVNAIQPGLVEGARIRSVFENKARALNKSYEDIEGSALNKVSLRTMVTPTQLADQILFLCSPLGRTISGQAISICGDTQSLV
jgi:NAD(P)-dependent dehydrogenase (short-subunit alcohol dehydrogenase family)